MSEDEILKMEAGPEMDRLIAVRVMGFDKVTIACSKRTASRLGEHWQNLRHYSARIADAWRVIEEMRLRAWWVSISFKTGLGLESDVPGYQVMFRKDFHRDGISADQNICVAICRAALLAVTI